jgi:nitrogen fixation-related uncharacterized protein
MKNLSSVFLGVAFILAGVAILLNQYQVFSFGWTQFYPLALIGLGVYFILDIVQGNKGAIFWATISISLGLFFFLRNFGYIPFFWIEEYWPLFMLVFGLAFISLFVIRPEDWGLLIPGTILTFLGILIATYTMGFSWYPVRLVWRFWPFLLVLVGIILIINSIKSRKYTDEKSKVTKIPQESKEPTSSSEQEPKKP